MEIAQLEVSSRSLVYIHDFFYFLAGLAIIAAAMANKGNFKGQTMYKSNFIELKRLVLSIWKSYFSRGCYWFGFDFTMVRRQNGRVSNYPTSLKSFRKYFDRGLVTRISFRYIMQKGSSNSSKQL